MDALTSNRLLDDIRSVLGSCQGALRGILDVAPSSVTAREILWDVDRIMTRIDANKRAADELAGGAYRPRRFWSPDRRYLVAAHTQSDGVVLIDDNGRLWEQSGSAEPIGDAAAAAGAESTATLSRATVPPNALLEAAQAVVTAVRRTQDHTEWFKSIAALMRVVELGPETKSGSFQSAVDEYREARAEYEQAKTSGTAPTQVSGTAEAGHPDETEASRCDCESVPASECSGGTKDRDCSCDCHEKWWCDHDWRSGPPGCGEMCNKCGEKR